MATPLFKSLSNEALRTEYRGYRNLAYNNAGMAASGAVNKNRAAGQMGKLMRNIEIIEAIARQRGISLASPVTRCQDCGEEGERTGHQTCQYPQNH